MTKQPVAIRKKRTAGNRPVDEKIKPTKADDLSKRTRRNGVRQFSVHLQESVHRDTKIALLLAGGKQDFSGLVEQLLLEYLSKQKFQVDNLAARKKETV
jgi:hypothetical protein